MKPAARKILRSIGYAIFISAVVSYFAVPVADFAVSGNWVPWASLWGGFISVALLVGISWSFGVFDI